MAIATAASAPERHRPGRRWLLLAPLLVVVLVVGWSVRWLTDDRALSGYGNTVTVPMALGGTAYLDAGVYPRGGGDQSFSIDVHRLVPRVTVNTADAVVSLAVCAQTQSHTRIGGSFSWSPLCSSVAPFHSGSLLIDDRKLEVLLVVTPRKAGVVHIEGLDASYRHGIRWGHQHVGIDTTVTTVTAR